MTDAALESRVRPLKLVIFDFDGVFTTNEVIVNQEGIESVVCNRSDGYGMRLLKACDLPAMILSTEVNPVVQARARKLALECISGCEDKGSLLEKLLTDRKLEASQVAFVGNDVNDVPCLRRVGLPVVVSDAFPEARASAFWVLKNAGGRGALREFCETVYRIRHELPSGASPWPHFFGWEKP